MSTARDDTYGKGKNQQTNHTLINRILFRGNRVNIILSLVSGCMLAIPAIVGMIYEIYGLMFGSFFNKYLFLIFIFVLIFSYLVYSSSIQSNVILNNNEYFTIIHHYGFQTKSMKIFLKKIDWVEFVRGGFTIIRDGKYVYNNLHSKTPFQYFDDDIKTMIIYFKKNGVRVILKENLPGKLR